MKKTYLFLLAITLSMSSYSQSISQDVIGNSGTTQSGGSATLSFTLGESIVGAISNGPSLGQGFWLGAIEEIILSNDDFNSTSELSVYPNPVSDLLYIDFSNLTGTEFKLFLVDLSGRTILQKELKNVQDREILSFNQLSSGPYLLKIVDTQHTQSKTFKIIKK